MPTPRAERNGTKSEVGLGRTGPASAPRPASSRRLRGIILPLFARGRAKPRISVTRHDRAVNYRCNELSGAGDVLTPAGLAAKLIWRALGKYVIRGLCVRWCARSVNNFNESGRGSGEEDCCRNREFLSVITITSVIMRFHEERF